MGGRKDLLTVEAPHEAIQSAAEPHSALHDRVEDRLDVGRRAGDDPEDLAGGGPLLEGLGEVAILGLELLEEADVLDGDDRLVGEGLQERDLSVREPSGLWTPHRYATDCLALAQHRQGKDGPKASGLRLRRDLVALLHATVRDVNDVTRQDGAGTPAS